MLFDMIEIIKPLMYLVISMILKIKVKIEKPPKHKIVEVCLCNVGNIIILGIRDKETLIRGRSKLFKGCCAIEQVSRKTNVGMNLKKWVSK